MSKKNCCIITPTEDAYSETFIQNHIRYLDLEKTVVYAVAFTDFKVNGISLVAPNLYNRLRLKILTQLLGKKQDHLVQKRFARLLKERKVDVVLAEYGPVGTLIADTCYALNIPLVVHFHGYDASVYSLIEKYGEAYRCMFAKASAIVAVSESMRERLKKLGAPEQLTRLNPYGVDTKLFKPSAEKKEKIFLAVGRFVEKKAPVVTIKAFHKALQQNNTIKLKIAGEGPLLNECKELVRTLGLQNAVEFLGVQSTAAVVKLMAAAYAFVQHSVIATDGNAEGLPLAILEAGASGLPVISTRHEGIADVIEHGFNGLLGDEFDVDTMADHILALANDEALATRLSDNARKRIVEKYNLVGQIAKLEEILKLNIREEHAVIA